MDWTCTHCGVSFEVVDDDELGIHIDYPLCDACLELDDCPSVVDEWGTFRPCQLRKGHRGDHEHGGCLSWPTSEQHQERTRMRARGEA